jgi:probable HAF family extracellular repeat protein
MVDLGTLGGSSSNATGINDIGQIVGRSETASGDVHAFRWENGAMLDLGTLGGSSSFATGINELGQIVGESEKAPGEDRAFRWENG